MRNDRGKLQFLACGPHIGVNYVSTAEYRKIALIRTLVIRIDMALAINIFLLYL
jgi:hypothetical protein